MWRFISAWLGLNPSLPYFWEVQNPVHGQEAKNKLRQKVVWDANVGHWVMPQNFSSKPPVTVTKG